MASFDIRDSATAARFLDGIRFRRTRVGPENRLSERIAAQQTKCLERNVPPKDARSLSRDVRMPLSHKFGELTKFGDLTKFR